MPVITGTGLYYWRHQLLDVVAVVIWNNYHHKWKKAELKQWLDKNGNSNSLVVNYLVTSVIFML